MVIDLRKAEGNSKCRHLYCEGKFDNERGRIKKGTICAAIFLQNGNKCLTVFYCRDCLEKIYIDMKSKLNPKLWIFD